MPRFLMNTDGKDIVLVHGAWHGAWTWYRMAPLLSDAGYRVHTPNLVGMGESNYLMDLHPRPLLGIRAHVAQIVAYLRTEQLTQITLVGHSYGGVVLAGVLGQMRESVKHAVFLDAFFPIPGRPRFQDLLNAKNFGRPPEYLRPWARRVLGLALRNKPIPAPPVAFMGLSDNDDAQYVATHMTSWPTKRSDAGVQYPTPEGVPLTYLRCTAGDEAMRNLMAPYAAYAQKTGWHYDELATGHDCMVSEPQATAKIILACAR